MGNSQTPGVIIDQAVLGGISDSIYMGKKNSLASIIGFNLHKVPGLFLVNQKMSKHSPSIGPAVVDDLVKIVHCSDGKKRLFGKTSGKIWEIDQNGAYTQPTVIPFISDPMTPTLVANDATVGTVDWVSPANVEVDDGVPATFPTGTNAVSKYLKTTGYGFAIPNGATITGIIVEVREYKTSDGSTNAPVVLGGSIKLVKGNTIQGTDYGSGGVGDNLYTNNQIATIGAPDNLWGLTLTPADVNGATFGVAISRTGTDAIDNIDVIRIRVCYTLNGKGSPVFDAKEYEGPGAETYVYYSLPNFLGRWRISDPITQRIDNYGEFYNGDTVAHPMIIQNLVLYIGDGNVVAQVDASGERTIPYAATAFSQTALRIEYCERVTALGKQTTALLVGSQNINGLNLCHVYNWDTFSRSFTQEDPIAENGVNAFMPDKLRTIISAGENGNFYEYVRSFYGQYLQPLEQIPPNFPTLFSPTNTGVLYHTAVDTLQSIPIFGFSRKVGNPALQGLYTLGSRDSTYPTILTLEYPVSTNNLQNITIWSLSVVGNDIYCSWMDETPDINGNPQTLYGVDKLDWNNKVTTASFETMIMKYTKTLMDNYKDFVVGYDQLPTGTSIDFYYDVNKNGYVKFNTTDDPNEFVADTDRKMYKATKFVQGRTVRFKVVVNSHNNDAPNIEDMTALLGS